MSSIHPLNLAMSALETATQCAIDRSYYLFATKQDILEFVRNSSHPTKFMFDLALLQQTVKRPTIGMLNLIHSAIELNRHLQLGNYHYDINQCQILDRCPVLHLLVNLRELPPQMCPPKELINLTKLLAEEHDVEYLYRAFSDQHLFSSRRMTVNDLIHWVELNLTNFTSYLGEMGAIDIHLCA